MHDFHARAWGPLPYRPRQFGEHGSFALRQQFHFARRKISHPTGNAKPPRFFPYEPTKAYALNPPGDPNV